MAGLHLLPIPIEWLSLLVSLVGGACLMANLFIVRRIALALSGGSAAVSAVATILTALSYPLAFWTLRGMEVGALTLAIDFVILQVLSIAAGGGRRQVISLAGAAAAALLLRPDAIAINGTIASRSSARRTRCSGSRTMAGHCPTRSI
jgi:hypothetical protein